MKVILQEMKQLVVMKTDLRSLTHNSKLDEAGVSILDQLLRLVPAQSDLTAVGQGPPTEGPANVRTGDGITDDEVDRVATAIKQSNNFATDYLDGSSSTTFTSGVFLPRKSAAPYEFKDVQALPELTGSRLLTSSDLQSYDADCTDVSIASMQSFLFEPH